MLLLAALIVPVLAVNEYRDPNAGDATAIYAGANTCDLRGSLRCGYPTLSPIVYMRNVNETDVNKTQKIYVNADGTFEYPGLAVGKYRLYVPDGNGGQPEESFAVCNGHGVINPQTDLMGHAVTSRADPKPADFSASLGCKDIDVKWVKMVKTGQHWYTPPCYEITVVDIPAWDEQILVHEAYDEYVFVGHNHGDYIRIYSSYFYVGHNHGDYDLIHHNAVYRTVHHPPVSHQETICPHPVLIPEYGIEFFIEIDGARLTATNPNHDSVNIQYSFDVNYWIDKKPWNNNAEPREIRKKVQTYTGTLVEVGQGTSVIHGTLTPDLDNAVMVVDFGQFGIEYMPYIDNDKVVSTVWTH